MLNSTTSYRTKRANEEQQKYKKNTANTIYNAP